MLLFQSRSEVLCIEADNTFCRPGTTRIVGVTPWLILEHNHGDGDTLFLVRIDEFAKVICIGLQVTWVLDKVIIYSQLLWKYLCVLFFTILIKCYIRQRRHLILITVTANWIVVIDFHPGRRRPWRHPESHIRIILLCSFDKRNQRCFIPIDIEMFQLEVTGYLIATVPVAGVVVGIHGEASHCKLQISFRSKQLLKNNLLLLPWKHVECIPSKFIKACPPGLEESSILRTVDLE